MKEKKEAQQTVKLAIQEIPNTNDTKLVIQQVDDGTGKEIARKELIFHNKSLEEVEGMVNAVTTKYITDGSLTQVYRKPFTH